MLTVVFPDSIVDDVGKYRCVPNHENSRRLCEKVMSAVDFARMQAILIVQTAKREENPQMILL